MSMSILFYKRPQYVKRPEGPLDATNCEAYFNRSNKCKAAIPPELSFEQIMGNKAAPVSIPLVRDANKFTDL